MTDLKRRKIMALAGATAVVPVASIFTSVSAVAAEMVDPASGQAAALKYTEASETEGQMCSNCALYQGGDEPKGPCPLFQGSLVAGPGWCTAWVAKP